MGLSTSLANALSGLNAASRTAEVISSNVANAGTPAYARRQVNLSAISLGGTGGGVRLDSISRSVNMTLLNDRRLADAAVGYVEPRASFLDGIEQAIGVPGTSGSLSDRYASLESALVQAASRPDSDTRLQTVVTSAQDLAATLRNLSKTLEQARTDADNSISSQVDDLNESLGRIDTINADILAARSSGQDATALMDQRQQLVDHIATIVPVREYQRDNDQIALYTTGGAILLEGTPARIGFTGAGIVTADMSLASGALSGLTLNGQPVATGAGSPLGGGSLGAQFAIRDDLAPRIQEQLDATARDLIERFQDPSVDPTLASGAPGLFTDAGSSFAAVDETGLAGRIAVNGLVDPLSGGATWRLRDGLGSAAPGNVGNANQLNALKAALTVERVPSSEHFTVLAQSAAGLGSSLLSEVSASHQSEVSHQAYSRARQSALSEQHLGEGVDTDAELQSLMQVEQAYAANARVIQTLGDMIDKLMEI